VRRAARKRRRRGWLRSENKVRGAARGALPAWGGRELDYGERLEALEARLRAAEDQLEIIQLLNMYGPLVDSGESEAAAKLWVDGGGYSFSGGMSGGTRLEAPAELVKMYESAGHKELVSTGVSHFTGMPRIVVNGDQAEAVGYSFVVLREGERWY